MIQTTLKAFPTKTVDSKKRIYKFSLFRQAFEIVSHIEFWGANKHGKIETTQRLAPPTVGCGHPARPRDQASFFRIDESINEIRRSFSKAFTRSSSRRTRAYTKPTKNVGNLVVSKTVWDSVQWMSFLRQAAAWIR